MGGRCTGGLQPWCSHGGSCLMQYAEVCQSMLEYTQVHSICRAGSDIYCYVWGPGILCGLLIGMIQLQTRGLGRKFEWVCWRWWGIRLTRMNM